MKSRLPAVITGLILIFVLIGFGTVQDFIPVLQKASSAPKSAQSLTPLNNSTTKGERSNEAEFSQFHKLDRSAELASYYDRHLAMKDGKVYGWSGNEKPKLMLDNVIQVGVSDHVSYALLSSGTLVSWTDEAQDAREVTRQVAFFSAGKTGLFVIRKDGSLWRFAAPDQEGVQIASGGIVYASIGDGADYYITEQGHVFVKGLAHRGQYGDGRLESTTDYVKVAEDAVQVKGHTGHAILLKKNGDVQGTGGNIFGPLSTHGLGDKATTWGTIFRDAKMIATGASHSAAIRNDNTLWLWGKTVGTTPVQVMERVVAIAAGTDVTLAKTEDGRIWFWKLGEKPKIWLE
ncbi:RCC1 domain-containing protein [Brevibacillus fortis]|uniref:RCC1 domain-containing protein n=1 Tax=Brevibacillus fortis TaxID=2126352 RepID=UPI0038FC366A